MDMHSLQGDISAPTPRNFTSPLGKLSLEREAAVRDVPDTT